YGRWEPLPKGSPAGPLTYQSGALGRGPRAGGWPGCGEVCLYGVNGDRVNDVATSLEAHGWGMAWYEQKRDKSGAISFTEHMIIDDFSSRNPGNVAFSEIHASTVADVDGDGSPDFIAGKRVDSLDECYTDVSP